MPLQTDRVSGAIGVGLIGTGFMGKCHALAFGAAKAVFGDIPTPRLELLCDVPADKARAMADQFGFARSTADWRELVADPGVDVVSITTPNKFHHQMALGAIAAGKHVYCEKPMGLNLEQAGEMAEAAETAGVKTLVGYNYLKNPAVLHAKRLIADGRIGRVVHFRGIVDEDYMADPDLPWSWRCTRAEAGLGVLGDLGCHLVSIALDLVGPIAELSAETQTLYAERPKPEGSGTGPVENEDIATALVRFEGGVLGTLSTSRAAWGRKARLAWEVHGERGQITFDYERMNELQLFEANAPASDHGFKTILTGPAHPPYGRFVPAAGHGLGFNDLKVIEVAHLLRGLAGDEPLYPDFAHALKIERVIHAMAEAGETGRWVSVAQRQS
ncbi:MAG: Gfo/Idh/MocA family oxidoreductase [Alphaproteobacteria bacterium]|nr:Gfo/Idh/MocA family oxidoreductase [Alphaproteobacteria bacterium]